jgi:cytochrome c
MLGMKSYRALAISFAIVFSSSAIAHAGMPIGNPAKGATLFTSNCATCHSAAKGGGDLQGPNLYDVYGRKAGSEAGFAYSSGFAAQHFVWDDAHLNQWLTKPSSVVPGTYMMYAQPDPKIRADIIAYLKSLDSK